VCTETTRTHATHQCAHGGQRPGGAREASHPVPTGPRSGARSCRITAGRNEKSILVRRGHGVKADYSQIAPVARFVGARQPPRHTAVPSAKRTAGPMSAHDGAAAASIPAAWPTEAPAALPPPPPLHRPAPWQLPPRSSARLVVLPVRLGAGGVVVPAGLGSACRLGRSTCTFGQYLQVGPQYLQVWAVPQCDPPAQAELEGAAGPANAQRSGQGTRVPTQTHLAIMPPAQQPTR